MKRLNIFKIGLLSLVASGVLALGLPAVARAQTATTVESAFTPFVSPSLPAQQPLVATVERRLCLVSANMARASETVVTIQSPQVLTPLTASAYAENQYFAEGLYRWFAGELARASMFTRPMTPAELLALVRRTYTPTQIVQHLCAQASGVCRPMYLWRATFLRDPWCAAVDRGETPLPSPGTVMAGTLDGSVCLDNPAPGVRSPYLPCPTPSRTGFVRILTRQEAGRLVLPTRERLTDGTYDDQFRFGGINVPGASGWGGGGRGERPLPLDEYRPGDVQEELDQYDDTRVRHSASEPRQEQQSPSTDHDYW